MKVERLTSISPLLWSGPISRKRGISLGRLLTTLLEKLSRALEKNSPSNLDFHRPQLSPPLPPSGSYRPPRYFSRGALESDRKKNPEPIPYLLTETRETARARLVPGNSFLFRSLCKGKGTLRQNKQGLIYLDIDNRFILSLIPYLKFYDLVRPPYFNLFGSPEGAHSPVIPAREMAFHFLPSIREVGREFSFEIEGLYSVEPTLWAEVEQVWFFKLKSVELGALRRRYFLPEKPGGHAFHLVVAVKARPTKMSPSPPLPVMRINPAYIAA